MRWTSWSSVVSRWAVWAGPTPRSEEPDQLPSDLGLGRDGHPTGRPVRLVDGDRGAQRRQDGCEGGRRGRRRPSGRRARERCQARVVPPRRAEQPHPTGRAAGPAGRRLTHRDPLLSSNDPLTAWARSGPLARRRTEYPLWHRACTSGRACGSRAQSGGSGIGCHSTGGRNDRQSPMRSGQSARSRMISSPCLRACAMPSRVQVACGDGSLRFVDVFPGGCEVRADP
jgi:hypothetical protein